MPSKTDNAATPGDSEERVIELSFQETNALRESLGLAPLRSSSKREIHDAPLPPSSAEVQAEEQRRKQDLKRQVEEGVQETFGTATLGSSKLSAKSWAKQLRRQPKRPPAAAATKEAHSKPKEDYGEDDLKGLTVGHAMNELADGSTTVLTLSDAPLLKKNSDNVVVGLNDDEQQQQLQNVNLAQDRKQQTGLREKRQLELGMGRANGYTGWDDDEFEEMGGTQAPSQAARGLRDGKGALKGTRVKGFRIGSHLDGDDEEEEEVAGFKKKQATISLDPETADVTASDFLTAEEAELEMKKEMKSFKKKSKKDKKKKKKKRRARVVESDDEDEEPEAPQKNLLDMLEETAVEPQLSKKRRREDDLDDPVPSSITSKQPTSNDKRSLYEHVMAKGNQRSKLAFGGNVKKFQSTIDGGEDEEPDDAFLNAALAKARRVNRLKEMKRGADVVMDTIQQQPEPAVSSSSSGNTITFAVDETREFTRALQARSEQMARKAAKQEVKQEEGAGAMQVETVPEDEGETLDIAELAKNMEEDNVGDLEGTTGATKVLGPGVGNVLHLLQQTGDLTSKSSGKELLRGRAKDERNYDDYEPVDLSQVVKIDHNTATAKDKEMAQREIKLEYRDGHGRLLTRKEAYRELCYQFHGHSSGKRKEEKKLQQIAREQAEASMASRDGTGTFGALQAAQKASGKAFIVHKSGKN